MNIFINEVGVLYEAFSRGITAPLPPLPIQYADFAYWQRQWLQGEVLESQLNYWKRQLAGSPPLLELPTDRPRPPVQTFHGNTLGFELSAELSRAIRDLSQQHGATLFVTLLAAFQTLLYRYSGQTDVSVGTPIANRNRSEIEGLIGFFVNTLVMRANLNGNPAFKDLLNQVKEVALGAYANQDLPFEMIVDELQPERNMSFSPLFQVVFTLQNTPQSAHQQFSNLTLQPVAAESRIAKFDITLSMVEQGEKLGGTFEYNTDLFDEATIRRMMKHFQILLEGIVSNPNQAIAKLPLLTESEKQQLLVEWNRTAAPFPDNKCAHELFEDRVMKTPGAIAVSMNGEMLNYFELNQKANRLAHYLQRIGVGPDRLVAICVERSIDMIVGLLAILKAGGAYVPLDPGYPSERLEFMLEDTGAPVLLTQSKIKAKLPPVKAQLILLDQHSPIIDQESDRNPVSNVTPDNLAYIIYTSGSTGKPKGVQLCHRGLCNFVTAYIERIGITSNDRILQFFSYGFDGSVADIFSALLSGATLCLVDKENTLPGPGLAQLIREQQVTTAIFTPSVLNILQPDEVKDNLQKLCCGGEATTREIVDRWASGRKLFNVYGPTEATVMTTCCLTNELPATAENIPIGRNFDNYRVYVVDEFLNPVPVGIPGELLIGGVSLARGYLNRPDITAEKFIPDPFSGEPGLRLYRSGDLVRYLPDGNIEFLRRIDHQVKVRGFRIELGEIEAVLAQHEQLKEVAVIVREDQPGVKRIVAYIVPETETAPTVEELREYLLGKLPEYMIPALFISLQALPLTPSGKVDRRALPVPEQERPDLTGEYVAPRTPEEKQLADIWRNLLGIERIGIYDNFFEIGGDSILTIQLVARAGQAGLPITPKHIFQNPTIEGLAKVIGTGAEIHAEQGVVTGSLPLTPIQHWFFDHHPIDPHHFNTSMLLELGYEADIALLKKAVEQMMIHHDALRLRFRRTDSGWQQINAGIDEEVPFIAVDLSGFKSRQHKNVIESLAREVQQSLNLSDGPLFRVVYLDPGPKKTKRLLIVFHHLVMDGVSWRIFMEDFVNVYQQLMRNETIQLPPRSTSFKFWSQRLTEYARTAEITRQIDYWIEVSAKAQQVPPLPLDYAQGINTYGSTRNVTLSLNRDDTLKLLKEVPRALGAEVNPLLITALLRLLRKWTGKSRFLIETEGHGREFLLEDIDLSRTIGWFTSMYPVFLDLEDKDELANQIELVKNQLAAIPNNGIGFGLLRYLSPQEQVRTQLSAMPNPDINFNYLGQFDQMPMAPQERGVPMRMARESVGPEQSPRAVRNSALYIVAIVSGQQLHVRWLYSKNLHKQSTIKKLARNYMEELDRIIQLARG